MKAYDLIKLLEPHCEREVALYWDDLDRGNVEAVYTDDRGQIVLAGEWGQCDRESVEQSGRFVDLELYKPVNVLYESTETKSAPGQGLPNGLKYQVVKRSWSASLDDLGLGG